MSECVSPLMVLFAVVLHEVDLERQVSYWRGADEATSSMLFIAYRLDVVLAQYRATLKLY
jgi:hypothetical protein